MISHKHKFIFVHIPKCAGTSIEKALLKYEGLDIDSNDKFYLDSMPELIKKEYLLDYPPHSYSQHFFLNQYEQSLASNYYCFAFVRNPWDLMVSEYFYILKNYEINLSFEEFIKTGDKLKEIKGFRWFVERGHHLLPQVNFLSENIDFIGRFENLQDDFDTICDNIKISRIDLPHYNSTNRNHYTTYYNSSTRETVLKRYKKDIEYFNYKFEG
tara:strand:+ start:175 stop:813 length:639 start_codon:yes stop_codon:yes gene_type:complete